MIFTCERCGGLFSGSGVYPLRLCSDCNEIRRPETETFYKPEQEMFSKLVQRIRRDAVASTIDKVADRIRNLQDRDLTEIHRLGISEVAEELRKIKEEPV